MNNSFCPFDTCKNDIQLLRLREKIGINTNPPRVLVLNKNSKLKTLVRDHDLVWQIMDQQGKQNIDLKEFGFGHILEIICSIHTDSLILFRH
jgi:hypothetical protein